MLCRKYPGIAAIVLIALLAGAKASGQLYNLTYDTTVRAGPLEGLTSFGSNVGIRHGYGGMRATCRC